MVITRYDVALKRRAGSPLQGESLLCLKISLLLVGSREGNERRVARNRDAVRGRRLRCLWWAKGLIFLIA
jgi:hypothetical protein